MAATFQMQAIISSNPQIHYATAAERAVRAADALLAELAK